MEEEKIWEQPSLFEDNVQVADAKEEIKEDNIGTTLSIKEDGSQLGKFKDAISLLSAYNNLQAEFTRKCQKLSELEKQKEEVKEEPKEEKPIFEEENWQDKVTKFLQTHKDAKQFASEISNEILTNPELKKMGNALDIAYANVISKKYKSPEEMLCDDKFVNDYVLSNEQITKQVLSKYFKDLESKKIPPFVSSSQGGNIAFSENKKASTLSEAKELVEAIFNRK